MDRKSTPQAQKLKQKQAQKRTQTQQKQASQPEQAQKTKQKQAQNRTQTQQKQAPQPEQAQKPKQMQAEKRTQTQQKQAPQPEQAQKTKQMQAEQPNPERDQAAKQAPKLKQAPQPQPTQATKSAPKRKSGQTSKQAPKRKPASKPKTASKRKSVQTAPPLSAYEARRKAEEARKQADLERIIQKLNYIQNSPSSSEPAPPEEKETNSTYLSAPKIAKGCLTLIVFGLLFTYALGRYARKQDERKRAAMEIKADVHPFTDQAGSPEAPARSSNTPPAAAPAETLTVSYQDYLLYQSLHNRYSGVELDLGNGITIQTGLDESEIMDQIAADGDIYSLTDYFDEYVGD